MGQILHGSTTTTHAVRAAIQRSKATAKELAGRYGLNPKTVAKWKKRSFVHDAAMGPKEPRSTTLTPAEEAIRFPGSLDRSRAIQNPHGSNLETGIAMRGRPPPGKKPLPAASVQRVVDLALSRPPGETTHWTRRMLAKAAGISLRSVQRLLEAPQLAPHPIRTFKLSRDPKFADKLALS